jgi:hypothetical protein
MKKVLCASVLMVVMLLTAKLYAGTATIIYTEPNTNQAGNTLTNLKETTIYWKQDGGVEQSVKVPASAPTGGATINKNITIADPPLCGTTSVVVQVTASNTNTTNFESVRSAPVTGTKTADATGCSTPNAPFNIQITIQ